MVFSVSKILSPPFEGGVATRSGAGVVDLPDNDHNGDFNKILIDIKEKIPGRPWLNCFMV